MDPRDGGGRRHVDGEVGSKLVFDDQEADLESTELALCSGLDRSLHPHGRLSLDHVAGEWFRWRFGGGIFDPNGAEFGMVLAVFWKAADRFGPLRNWADVDCHRGDHPEFLDD